MMADANIAMSPSSSYGSDSGIFSPGQAPLPADMLDRARDRVRIAALCIAGLWLFVIVTNEGVRRLMGGMPAGAPVWTLYQSALTVAGFVLSVTVAIVVIRLRDNPGWRSTSVWDSSWRLRSSSRQPSINSYEPVSA